MRSVIVAYILAVPLLASAQAVYKCGSTYSQTPCGAGAQEIVKDPAPTTQVPPDDVVAGNLALCERRVRDELKDPESAQVRKHRRGGSTTLPINGQQTRAVVYYVDVNAKNSYGGYVGFHTYACAFDTAETKILLTLDLK